jgi:hypothetical protein
VRRVDLAQSGGDADRADAPAERRRGVHPDGDCLLSQGHGNSTNAEL